MSSARWVATGSLLLGVVVLPIACGGSASETPFPLEPVGNERSTPTVTPSAAAGGTSGVQDSQEAAPEDSEALPPPDDPGGTKGAGSGAPSTWGATEKR